MKTAILITTLAVLSRLATPALAEERLLQETLEFSGAIYFAGQQVPGMVIGAVRNGDTAVIGFGRVSDDSDAAPDGDTLLRIGSITKVFTGAVLAKLVADGRVNFTDPLASHLQWDVALPERDGRAMRLIDLVTHTSGLPREVDAPFGPNDDPYSHQTEEAFISTLEGEPLLFAPGSGALYSNFAYHLLATALEHAADQPFPELLAKEILQPAGLTATTYVPGEAQRANLMQGHDFDGSPLPDIASAPSTFGSGALYSTANDMLRWLRWHLDRGPADAELRLLGHAAYVDRDGLNPVYGMDESGRMDAMGLGWVVMRPQENRPLILQKAGGMQGVFSYVAFAPTRNIGVFMAINQYDFPAALAMAETVNDLIAELAPR